MRRLLALLLISLLPTLSIGQTAPSASSPAPQVSARTPLPKDTEQTQIALLTQQLASMREYHTSLLDTVYWALAAVFTLTVLLAGFGWWSNFKLYENDKARLRDELQALLRSAESSIALRAEEARTESSRAIDARLEAFSDRIQGDISEVRDSIGQERKERQESLERLDSALKQITENVSGTLKMAMLVESNLRQVEEHVWDLRGVPDNILITQTQGVTASHAAKSPEGVTATLLRMKATLEEKYVKEGARLDEAMTTLLSKSLAKVSDEFAVQVTEIRRLVDQVREQVT